jgi:hypothetical protein
MFRGAQALFHVAARGNAAVQTPSTNRLMN